MIVCRAGGHSCPLKLFLAQRFHLSSQVLARAPPHQRGCSRRGRIRRHHGEVLVARRCCPPVLRRDFGILDAFLGWPLAAPEDNVTLRCTRESERLSFYDYLRVHASSVTRWSRFYKTVGPQRGQAVLMVMRMYPKKKNDTNWIYVKPDRTLGVGDIKDRAKLSSRRQQGWDIEAFPALTGAEKTEIVKKA